VQRQVDQLNRQAEQAAERYNTAKVELTDTTRQLRAARNKYAATQRRLDAMKVLVGRIAVASYKSGGLDSSVQLLLSDNPTGFLRQAADLTQVTKHQDHLLADMQSARLSAAVDRKAVAEQQARAQDLQSKIAAEKRTVEASWHRQALLGRLQAKQRLQLMSIRQAATDRASGLARTRCARLAPRATATSRRTTDRRQAVRRWP
jgi:hypothetical protein